MSLCLSVNYLIIESLRGLARTYPDLRFQYLNFKQKFSLYEIWRDICVRIFNIFQLNNKGQRPVHGGETWSLLAIIRSSKHCCLLLDVELFGGTGPWNGPDYVLFFEYFDGDTGRGCGAK